MIVFSSRNPDILNFNTSQVMMKYFTLLELELQYRADKVV